MTRPSAPPAPTLKSPINGSLTSSLSPTLEWQPSAGDASYGLQVATDQGFRNPIIDEKGLKEVSYVVPSPKLDYGKTYYWRVGVGNAGGKSGWSPSWSFVVQSSILGIHTTQAVGEQKVIVIMADFPDVKPTITKEQIYNKVFVDLDNYFRDASYGKMWLTGNVTGPYVLPHPISDYNTTLQNLTADKTRMLSLVQNTMDAADGDVNFSQYSHVMIVLGASFRQYTAKCFSALPGMLGSSGTERVVTKSGQIISSAAVFSEDNYLGNFVHDTMHMLGGVIGGSRVTPCLYDQDLQGSSSFTLAKIHIGNWDPLSCHFYTTALPSSGLVSWTKLRLGWIEPSKIAMVSPGQTTTVTLDPLDSSASSTLVIKIPLTSDTFYLVENRQKVGFDQYAPSTGVLISYADDGYKGECRHGQGPVQLMDATPSVPYLDGAAFDIGKKEIFKDTQNNLAIILLRKVGLSYEIKITTADKADIASGTAVLPTFPEGFQRTK
jgi:M6 family metalloprotease-like protein